MEKMTFAWEKLFLQGDLYSKHENMPTCKYGNKKLQ